MRQKYRPVPLSEVAARFDLGTWLHRNMTITESYPPEFVVICPSCGRPKCAINVDLKAWHCLSAACDYAGWDPALLIADVQKTTYASAESVMVALVNGEDAGPLPEVGADFEVVRTELPQGTLPNFGSVEGPQIRYLNGRNVPPAHCLAFGLYRIGGLPNGTKAGRMLNGRLFIPVWMNDKIVYWTARSVQGEQPKTINMPRSCRKWKHPPDCTCAHEDWGLPLVPQSATAGEVVLGLHLVKPGEPVIVVEGDMDAVVCGPGFVSTLGAHCTPEQAMQIARTGASEAIVLFDGDHAGEIARWKAAAELDLHLPTRVATCPPGVDPAILGERLAREITNRAPRPGGLPTIRGRTHTSKWAWPDKLRPLEPLKEA